MRAMVFRGAGRPLELELRALPRPGPGELLVRVLACGVCRTDLHIADGDLAPPCGCVVPGHEVVGTVEGLGDGVRGWLVGDRVGIPWLGWACGECDDCRRGRENLCSRAVFTGHGRDGGYASHVVAHADFCVALPHSLDPVDTAPLLCAGLIGWRALQAAGDEARVVGLYGFGASAHLIAQAAKAQGRHVFAFTRPADVARQAFARTLGADWAGGTDTPPPQPLDAAILFAPDGALVPLALSHLRRGGRVVCAGIHMSDIPAFPYALLWGEREVRSVANLTRDDARSFFAFVHEHPLKVHTTPFALERANEALNGLRAGTFEGAAVLVP
ncbi:zinc-dependent alcohol dehydrogenase family protein [Piscinibacter sp. HJYY11]|uniref:zinc-dependent alcohol dehydrogenase family protein n=1 Tax=Piscinibacter sp. HJYY11 TaxID=2801333 RepID=UPI00191FC806|nr:zinc-dependent alcohol dehydrogenase family protein [Piscinibacter sp. HJYY11]MBL0726627.1 zinc-dependent alcohol dehydrogenase family protein [Piscinibacter sp. HJYY11]